jgi:protein involved in polysaccharide export with SLBB domain
VRLTREFLKVGRFVRYGGATAVALLLTGGASVAMAQKASASLQRASRTQLQDEAAQMTTQVSRSKPADRVGLQERLSAIQSRLENGDFKPGDRFVISLRQDSVRSDTLVVRDSLRVAVLNLPDFSVAGVLRSELEEKLTAHVARFIRNASVRTTLLTRVSVTGAVARPGFYYAIPDRPLNDLITSAGGPGTNADLTRLSISRAGKTLVTGKVAKRSVEDGSTLESLDVQSGDTVYIPVKRQINWQTFIQLAFVFTSVLFAFLQFLQWYYNRQEF